MLSLPSAGQLASGDFSLDETVERLMEALIDESQWDEILLLTGDTAVRLMECLDKVSEIR